MSTTELIKRLKQNFDDFAHTIEGVEVWFARDLQKLLGYDKWQRFQGVIAKMVSLKSTFVFWLK